MTIDSLSALYHSGGLFVVGLVLVYGGLKWLSTGWSWLAVPKRAHYVTAFLTALGVVAVPASQGTTPNASMILTALGTLIALLAPGINAPPAPPPQPVPAPAPAPSGFVRLGLAIALALGGGAYGLVYMTGCSAGPAIIKAGECILDNGVLATVVKDLASADYLALLAQLDPSGTDTLVGCALNTCATLDAGADAGYSTIAARARELLVKRSAAVHK